MDVYESVDRPLNSVKSFASWRRAKDLGIFGWAGAFHYSELSRAIWKPDDVVDKRGRSLSCSATIVDSG